MAVYTETRTYHTKAHMGMIDVTEDFRHAVEAACREKGISAGTITGFTTGGVPGALVAPFLLTRFCTTMPAAAASATNTTGDRSVSSASASTTENFYAHIIEENKAKATECIADVLLRKKA